MSTTPLVELTRVRALTRSGTARSLRVGAGLSLGEVAKAVGVDASTVLRWERAERAPRGDAALRYGQVLRELLGQ